MASSATTSDWIGGVPGRRRFVMNGLSSFVYGVVIDADLILLDVRADRYHALVGAVASRSAPATVGVTGPVLVPEAAAALIDAGLMVEGRGRGFSDMHAPAKPLPVTQQAAGGPKIKDCIDLLAAVVTSWWRLRRGMPCRSHDFARPTAPAAMQAQATTAIQALQRARFFIPTPRRCLPASLTACVFLARRGVHAQIVFGVRSHPFEAHCWVEHDGMVLYDDVDRVSAYHPIAVGQP